MKFSDFLKDKIFSIFVFLFADFFCFLFLTIFKVINPLIVIILFVLITSELSILFYEFFRRRNFYNYLDFQLKELDQKYLITELLQTPNFLEGKIIVDSLYEINKSMIENLNQYKHHIEDYKNYLEMWIHEIKIPLSNIILHLHNQKSEVDSIIIDQIKKLEDYMDQILYYSRGEYAEVDYFIKECSLKKIINHVILRNKESLFHNKIHIHFEKQESFIFTDSKWLEFILNQIIINSIKYQAKNINISIYEDKRSTTLSIRDDGIGILKSDLPRIFEKSFTGKNGHHNTNSTGMGLYICHNLCKKLGHSIEAVSEVNEFTEILITFSKQDFYTPIHDSYKNVSICKENR